MKKETKSLKKLQEELVSLIKNKKIEDEDILECINEIDKKYIDLELKAEIRKRERELTGYKIKNLFVKLSLSTLKFLDKLITKEKVDNEIMNRKCYKELENAEQEIKSSLNKYIE